MKPVKEVWASPYLAIFLLQVNLPIRSIGARLTGPLAFSAIITPMWKPAEIVSLKWRRDGLRLLPEIGRYEMTTVHHGEGGHKFVRVA